jgi:hypothetical protein
MPNTILVDVPHARYHADDFGSVPTLSRSIAHLLVARSPLHAWAAHPRLGGALVRDDTAASDNGSLMHALLFGGAEIAVIDAKDFRKREAREQRDAARQRGALPVLAHVYENAAAVAGLYRDQLLALGINPAACGREVIILWEEDGGVQCRARLDMCDAENGVIYDAKFIRNGRPSDFARTMVLDGYDMQAAAYTRALRAVSPSTDRATLEFVLCESTHPYAVTRASLAESMRSFGEQRWRRAVAMWSECLASNSWPGYGAQLIEAPAWALSQEFDEQVRTTPEPEWARGA